MFVTLDDACEAARIQSGNRNGVLVTVYEVRHWGRDERPCRRRYLILEGWRPRLAIEPGRWLVPVLSYHLGSSRHPLLSNEPGYSRAFRGNGKQKIQQITPSPE